MKDIKISGKRIQTELRWLLGCFIAAVLFDIYAMVRHGTPWAEFFKAIHVLLILSVVFYVLLLFFRALITLIMRFSARKKRI